MVLYFIKMTKRVKKKCQMFVIVVMHLATQASSQVKETNISNKHKACTTFVLYSLLDSLASHPAVRD